MPNRVYLNDKRTLKIYNGEDGKPSLIEFFCPGCGRCHPYAVNRSNPLHNWEFNGSMDAPTFAPSLRVFKANGSTECHLFVKAGKIEFCGDCPHAYAGKTVDLPTIPEE